MDIRANDIFLRIATIPAIGVMLALTFSCWGQQKAKRIEYEFLYGRFYDGDCGGYERRTYEIENDRIVERTQTLNTFGKILNSEQRTLFRTETGLDILVKGKRMEYLNLEPGNCREYDHPMGFVVQTCFNNTMQYKGYKNVIKYSEQPLTIDGVTQTIHLDSNFCLIDKLPKRSDVYDSLTRVSVPGGFR